MCWEIFLLFNNYYIQFMWHFPFWMSQHTPTVRNILDDFHIIKVKIWFSNSDLKHNTWYPSTPSFQLLLSSFFQLFTSNFFQLLIIEYTSQTNFLISEQSQTCCISCDRPCNWQVLEIYMQLVFIRRNKYAINIRKSAWESNIHRYFARYSNLYAAIERFSSLLTFFLDSI